jgi:hypothetical protein
VTALLILGAMVVPIALGWLGLIGWPVILIAEVAIILVAGWRFDRGRPLGAVDPVADANRADMSMDFGNPVVSPLPKEALQTRADRLGPSHDPTGRGASR